MRLVTATDILLWSDTVTSRSVLPELLRRLIQATAEIEELDFPAGEGVQKPGWDGIVVARSGNQFVPQGNSGWECGCDRRVRPKAESDLEKRSAAPTPLTPANATFVFVTPRRWAGKRTWRLNATKAGFKQVRVFDADDLEQWLELAPAVAAWFADRIGKAHGVEALDTWWDAWRRQTDPPLAPGIALASRSKARDRVGEWLKEPPSVLTAVADTAEEAVAFLCAAADREDSATVKRFWSRALLANNLPALDLTGVSDPQVIVLREPLDPTPSWLARHHVFYGLSRGSSTGAASLDLGTAKRRDFESSLREMGYADTDASRIAHGTGCSLPVLRRQLAKVPLPTPTWATQECARTLIPALLATAWDESSEGDRETLRGLAGEAYEGWSAKLTAIAVGPDAPVRHVGTVWRVTSPRDAFFLLAPRLTGADLGRFEDAAIAVMALPDPKLELEPDQRWMAAVYGKRRKHSDHLRHGLAASLALVSTLGCAAGLAASPPPTQRAAFVVRKLLDGADAQRWTSAADLLPELAEAAPDTFLDAVEASLGTTDRAVMSVFDEVPGPLGRDSQHAHLLWALEGIAWDPVLLGRASLVLARLAEFDPGGHTTNRPAQSLRDIYLLWHPQTDASLHEREVALAMLLQASPAAAWDLLLRLVPSFNDFQVPNHKMRWRDSGPDPKVTNGELNKALGWLAGQLIIAATSDGRRWSAILDACGGFSREHLESIVAAIPNSKGAVSGGSSELWTALRKTIGKHRRFRNAVWALPGDIVNQLVPLRDALAPSDPIELVSWLFGNDPDIPDPPPEFEDLAGYDLVLAGHRCAAVASIQSQLGLDGVARLVDAATQPWHVIQTFVQTCTDDDATSALLKTLLGSPELKRRCAGRGMVAAIFARRGWNWADSLLADSTGLPSPGLITEFLHGLPFGEETWDRLASLGAPTEEGYWATVRPFGQLTAAERDFAAARLLRAGRTADAAELASFSSEISVETTIRILRALPDEFRDRPARSMDAWHIERLFAHLDGAGIDRNEVAKLEVPYLSILADWSRPVALHELLATDPSLFAELVGIRYRPNSSGAAGIRDSPTGDERARARAVAHIFGSWRGFPGRRKDGSTDGEFLKGWTERSRSLCGESDRQRPGDYEIGRVLARTPPETNGPWPMPPVREILESARSTDLEKGVESGVTESLGVTSRLPDDGGEQERTHAARYRGWGIDLASSCPRTSAMLRRIAEQFETFARHHDRAAAEIEWEQAGPAAHCGPGSRAQAHYRRAGLDG